MTRLRPPAGWAIQLSLAGAAALGAIAPAWADKPLQLSFKESPGFARITAKWGDGDENAPKISASITNQVLILAFDQKVAIEHFEAIKDGLPSWAAVTHMDPDGKTARVGLKQVPRLHLSMSVDLTAIDLVPDDQKANPPNIVSPLLAKRAAEAEAKRVKAIPPPPAIVDLEVRGSSSADSSSSRIAFYWDGGAKVPYKVVSQSEGELKLLFGKRAKADLAYIHITPPPNLADPNGLVAENTDNGYLVTIRSKDKLPIKQLLEGDILVVDITKPAPPPGAAATPAPAKKGEPAPAAPKPQEKPILLTPPKSLLKSDEAAAAEAAQQAAAAEKAAADAKLGGPERVTVLSSNWTDSAPRSGVVDVKISPLATGLDLQAVFAAPTPAAVFSRGSAVWAVFAANADLKVDPTQLPTGYKVRTMRGKNATLMRIEIPKGLTVSADANEASWTIHIAPTAIKPQRFLKVDRKKGDSAQARIESMLIGAAGLVWFEDPVIGDKIAAAVAYGPTSASPTPRDFVEASIPATAHGLAIAPKSDNVLVTIEGERVVVAGMAASQSGPDKPDPSNNLPKIAANPAFIDFAGWGAGEGKAFRDKFDKLSIAAAQADPASDAAAQASLDLARFYLGHEMQLEALGVLKVAAAERPELEQDPVFLGLRGAANYLAHRLKQSDDDLSKGPLRNDNSAALWRAMVAAGRGEWERACDFFHTAADQIYAYPPAKAAEFSIAWAESALNTNDYDTARRKADAAIKDGDREVKERGQLVLATLTSIMDGPAAAYDEFDRLSKEASEPVAVRAELKRLDLGVAANKMSANDAAGELESLRFRWRGDEVEMATVGILADQYMRVGRFRDALLLAQSTALRDANAPGARDLRMKVSDYFRRLFLNGEVDRLDPIQAVALFYEFENDLLPNGNDGDMMVRKLAQRLVAFDLLEPAAQVLQYQIDNRLRGIAQSAIAVDLASIYLWDKRPDRALAAINSTRQPQLPKDLAIERRLLEAAAYRDLGRNDHTVELVEPLEGPEAKSLLADAYWRDRKWTEAAQAFLSMLPPPSQAKPVDADAAFKAAIAARMAKDPALIKQVRPYAAAMADSPNKASFDLIVASTDVAGTAVAEAVKRIADAPRVDALAAAMKKRFEATKATPVAAAAPAPAAPAAAPAAAAPVKPAIPAATAPAKPAAPAAGQSASATPAPSASGGGQ